MNNDRKHPGTDDPDFARRLSDGFALKRACEDDEIDPMEHLGRVSGSFLDDGDENGQ